MTAENMILFQAGIFPLEEEQTKCQKKLQALWLILHFQTILFLFLQA